ncbi:hypothetical protein [Streptomyces sparsogenes]|uniref:LmbE family protein n=1 Tax=Streptomyces sparsogenes DSM 40356 TaxID=1331668 RepID=A0A1R1SRI7_9ACTN|nr:hypothetical protein [Streptomyces sparsogenes]OMI40930.1 hypothetical protein SPAR_03406 [Streptomyces sparsogenes DSM 40356]
MALRLLRGKDGRLTAYAPVAGGVARWTEERPGGPRWTGPRLLEVAGLTALTGTQGADGYVHLVGLRHRQGGGDGPDVDIVHATQFQTGRPLTAWHSLGTPHPKDRRKAQRTGVPAAAVDSSGAVHVFVRNAGRGVSARRQDAKGKWGGWTDLKGTDVLDGLSATAAADGRIELLAPAARGALRWHQPEPGAAYQRADDIPARPEAGSAAGVATGVGTVTHYWRDAVGLEVLAWRPGADEPAPLGGETGTGPVAVVRTTVDGHDCTVLAHRDAKSGRLAVAAHPTEYETAGVWWTPSGEPGTSRPALALDGLGLVVLAALAPDGGLLVARQKTDEPGLALRAWGRVGE